MYRLGLSFGSSQFSPYHKPKGRSRTLVYFPRSGYERASLNKLSSPDLQALDAFPSGNCVQMDFAWNCLLKIFFLPVWYFKTSTQAVMGL